MAAEEKEEEEEATRTSAAAVGDAKVSVLVPPLLELCDELWFFRNALRRDVDRPPPRAALPVSPAKGEGEAPAAAAKESPAKEARPRTPRKQLPRAPSLPAYRSPSPEEPCAARKVAGGNRANGVLPAAGSRMAYCDGEEGAAAQREGGRDRPRAARSSKLQRSFSGCPAAKPSASSRLRPTHFASQTHLFLEANHRTYAAVHGNKWRRSHSDLESLEVQGFKDLGFVFDAGASHLASIIPGLREKNPSHDDDAAADRQRPYLSEAWFVERAAAAPPNLEWPPAERRSAEEMREQLKFWARAVACNVRPET